jgi:PAS domain S-box-containing protein
MKILIVDDKAENTYLLESLLNGNGFEITTAVNGLEALGLAVKIKFDLIISDILMPIMDGFTFCRECKKNNELKDIPFIFYTATYTDPKDEKLAMDLGADKYIVKPMDLDIFLKIIIGVLDENKVKKAHLSTSSNVPEEVVLKEYNSALIRKLEDKMTQVEEAEKKLLILNAELHSEIEEHKLTEDALRISEEKFRITFEDASIGMCLTCLDGRFILVNNAMSSLLGYTKEEMFNKKFTDFAFQDDTELNLDWMDKMISGQLLTHRFEKRYLNKNGNAVFADVNLTLIRDSKHTPLFFVAYLVDITERKQAEKQIALLAHAVKGISECISITDEKDNLIFVNDAFLKTYGYTEKELLGKHISIVRAQNEETISEYNKILPATISGGWKGEIINRKKDGTEFPVNLSTSVIKVDENKSMALIGVATDISENKKMLAELIAAKNRAEEMNRLKSNFMANMSHELRTPLVGLLGISETMKSETDGECQKNAEIIHESGLRLLKTITEILNFSKLESDKVDVNYSVVNLTKLLTNKIKFYQNMALQKGVTISKSFSQEDIHFKTDEKLLHEIIDNLFSNAVKFTHSGNINIAIEIQDGSLYIKISDTGIGIPEDKLEIIFEEFRQISEGMSRNYEGTGLGLTIVKKYARLLNGDVYAVSKFGAGSTFTIRLPFTSVKQKKEPAAGSNKLNDLDAASLNDKVNKVLIVEDDLINSFTIERILKRHYVVFTAQNGPDAIEEAKKNSIDIILMDINLKHSMNGMEAAKNIRTINGYEKTPIIAMTAYTMPGDKEEFLRSGCSHYLAKPFTNNELFLLLREVVKANK